MSAPTASIASIPALDEAGWHDLRAREYGRLDALDHVYLDYTGGGLYAEWQLREHLALLSRGVFGNPHSTNPTSRAATELAERARAAVLEFFTASPDEYTVVFTPNASGALRLVGEAYAWMAGDRYLLTADNHSSVNGIREFARAGGAEVQYLPLSTPELRVDDAPVRLALARLRSGRGLFAYPAQSNYSGVKHPLDWIGWASEHGWDVLLDAAAFVPTTRLDLSLWRPDFVTVSFYKMFGYPTGVGALIARRESLARLYRPWFAGGTIASQSVALERHVFHDGPARFEDGTIDYLSLPAIEIGLRHLAAIDIDTLGARVRHLTSRLLERLVALEHPNGARLVRIHGPETTDARGNSVAFNVLTPRGDVVDFRTVEARANERRISLRTGCFCNHGASEAARGMTPADLRLIFERDTLLTLDGLQRVLPGHALGAVRVSVGIATTQADLERFIELLASFAEAPVDRERPQVSARRARERKELTPGRRLAVS
jgi:selenocysteine lyase/cysteine desulfurase